jgi:hypothetical protein
MMFLRWLKSIAFPTRTRRVEAHLTVTCLGGEILEDRIVPSSTTDINDYVTQVYIDLLDRAVDPGGLSYWTTAVTEGTSFDQLVLDIESSPEFRYDQIGNWYEKYLDRTPDLGGLVYWGSQLENESFEPVQAGILGSNEFFNDAGGTNAGFLSALYKDVLGRAVDATGESTYGAELNSGMSRTAVAFQVLTSPEYQENLINNYYEQFLHRSADSTGMSFWSSQLSQGVTDQEMIAGLMSSSEYLSRIPNAPVITTPSAAITLEGSTFTIVGTAESGSNVQISSDGSVVGSEQLTPGSTNFSITVPLTANSANNFTATATNSFGRVSDEAIVPTITETPGIIKVTAPATQEDKDGDVISDVKVTATDTDSNTLSYSASNLPTGLTIDSKTGVISGTISSSASAPGSKLSPYNVTVTASDGVNSDTASFAWVVLPTTTSTTPLPFSLTDSAWKFDSSGVRTWDVTTGTGTTAAAGDSITVTYTGYLANGTVFNPTTTGFTATLSTSNLIPGWVDGIPGMKVGGERRLDIPSALGYGTSGHGTPGTPTYIPPNSELVFDITLTAVS